MPLPLPLRIAYYACCVFLVVAVLGGIATGLYYAVQQIQKKQKNQQQQDPGGPSGFRPVNANVANGGDGHLCMDVWRLSTADGADVKLWTCKRPLSDNQMFTLSANGQLVAKHSGKCLDVRDQGTASGTRVQQWTCSGAPNQRWTVDGQQRLVPANAPTKCLAPATTPFQPGVELSLQDCSDDPAQTWFT